MASKPKFEKYGLFWEHGTSALDIEFYFIRRDGFMDYGKRRLGNGPFFHYRESQRLIWPDDDYHRWSDIALQAMAEHDITVFMGPGDSNKTYSMAKFCLVDYWAQPNHVLSLISSTESRSLELRIWGKIKELYNRAKDLHPELPGKVLDSMKAISTDGIADDKERARELTKGMICIPCTEGSKFVGLGRFIGIKPPKDGKLRHFGDEVPLMQRSFLDAYDNWYGKKYFKGVMSGNPTDPSDPLGLAAEPEGGWASHPEPTKTSTWKSKFFDAFVVNFVGTDSPNFDHAPDPIKYHYLISHKKLDMVAKRYGKHSAEYYRQCIGVMKPGLLSDRIITRQLCRECNAQDKALWFDNSRVRIYGCDPAYGGGDRCVGIILEMGKGIDGRDQVSIYDVEVIPINLRLPDIPEIQIANFLKSRLKELGIPTSRCFYDSTGKGTLGYEFSKVFTEGSPVPIDSGAKPTNRPVRYDLFVKENNHDRLKLCSEHYSKFVTEMWFSVREVISSKQLRQLPEEVMHELCLRKYEMVSGNRYEAEPKGDMKERTGYSPDLADSLVIGIEGARRCGLKIDALGVSEDEAQDDYWAEEHRQLQEDLKSHMLIHN